MDESVKKKLEEIEKANAEKALLEALTKEFPDLKIHTNRWGRKRYSAKSANSRVDQYDSGFNCGCCEDSPLEIWPYLETMGTKIHSDPTGIMVADRYDSYDGEEYRKLSAYAGWKDRFVGNGISEKVINAVEEELRSRAPSAYEYVYEERKPKPKPVRTKLVRKRNKGE